MFKNAQREGPVVNLRLGEVERAVLHQTKSGQSVHVYKVWPKHSIQILFVVFCRA